MKTERRQPEMPWIVQDGAYEVNEAWCGVTVNGIPGYGVSEWGYGTGRGYERPYENSTEDAGADRSNR